MHAAAAENARVVSPKPLHLPQWISTPGNARINPNISTYVDTDLSQDHTCMLLIHPLKEEWMDELV